PVSDFGKELENGFREIGYGMQRVAADHGPMFLSYSKAIFESSGSLATVKYQLYLGDVGFERVYAIATNSGGIAPNGPMLIYGTNAPITLNADLFPGQSVEVEYVDEDEIELAADSITVIDQNVMNAITELRLRELPEYRSLNSQNQEVENLFNRDSSNFESIDDNYRTVRRDIIIFDDDSLVLKKKGREQITRLMKLFDPATDVFRLIGCSIGPTNIEGGNVELAMGRSERVAKELLSRDVDIESIFDEGCWAPESGASADYPSRAVVIQLQRRA
ncbi:MAG: hypothetical protein KTR32_05055, partial [Granulosicoccus sp.]|nr:hypothetical protein [Granulosicoccus sp.]